MRLVQLGHDELLAGMGDVEAAEAVAGRLVHERADVRRGPPESSRSNRRYS